MAGSRTFLLLTTLALVGVAESVVMRELDSKESLTFTCPFKVGNDTNIKRVPKYIMTITCDENADPSCQQLHKTIPVFLSGRGMLLKQFNVSCVQENVAPSQANKAGGF